jgi:phage gp36-like protein
MPYTDQTALETAFGPEEVLELADRDRDGEADSGVLDAAIALATGIIDGYLRAGGYPLPDPSADTPAVILVIANALTRSALYVHSQPEEVKSRAEEAMKLLRDIQAHRLNPFQSAETAPDIPGTVAWDGPEPVYTDDSLRGY